MRHVSSLLLAIALAAGCAAAPTTSDGETTNGGAAGDAGDPEGSEGGAGKTSGKGGSVSSGAGSPGMAAGGDAQAGGAGPSGGGTTGGPVPGLPCEVTALLQTHCWACHGATPSGGASFSLMTLDQLKAPSGKDPSLSYAQRSVIRMQASSSPMPPSPATPVPAGDIAAFDAWVKAGLPETGCNPGGAAGAAGAGGAEGGAGSAGSAGGVVDPYNTPLMCTSNQQWTGGDSESELMHPGVACKTCHALGGKAGFKTFDVAGTVYPSAHEPNDCNGVSVAGAKVIIIDAKNQEHPLDVNAAGNFYHLDLVGFGAWPPPYRARVEYNGKKREMVGPQMSGDCNSCHNETGTNNAPGRIMLP